MPVRQDGSEPVMSRTDGMPVRHRHREVTYQSNAGAVAEDGSEPVKV